MDLCHIYACICIYKQFLFTSAALCGHPFECHYEVCFIDYGNIDTVFGYHVLPLPVEFSHLPLQALYITFRKDPLSCSLSSLPSDFIGSIVNVQVITCQAPNTFEVTVLESKTCKSIQEYNDFVHTKINHPNVKLPFQAVLAHVNTVTDFYIHQLDRESAEGLGKMEREMHIFYSKMNNHHIIDENEVVYGKIGCVFSVIHSLYCRAVVLHVGVDLMCKVHLFDYGNTEMVSLPDLLVLPTKFLHLPICSIHCQLIFKGEELSSERIEKLSALFKPMAASLKVFKVVQGV